MTILLIILGVFVYSGIGGMTYRIAENKTGETGAENPVVFFSGLLWPIALPAGAGSMLMDIFSSETRTRLRHTKELSEAQHRRELAKIAADELRYAELSLNIK